jgi:hypothetical protein
MNKNDILVGIGYDNNGNEVCWEYYPALSTMSSLNYFSGDQSAWVRWVEI